MEETVLVLLATKQTTGAKRKVGHIMLMTLATYNATSTWTLKSVVMMDLIAVTQASK